MTHLLPGGVVPSEPCPSPASPFCHPPVSASLSNHGYRRLPTTPPPQCLAAGGAGAAGPVLLACRQWDPLEMGLRLPSCQAGEWHCVPLLPWLVQCPGRVCAALVAASGVGAGAGSRVPLLPPPLPLHSSRSVWRVVPSGCPVSSPAGTPFHAACAFPGSVRLLFNSAPRALCVCVRPPPPPVRCGARTTRGSGVGCR